VRLYIGVRGNHSLTFLDTSRQENEPPVLKCPLAADGDTGTDACAVKETDPPNPVAPAVLPDEPYALRLDPARDLLYVAHLRGDTLHPNTGGISLFDIAGAAGPTRDAPRFLKASPPFFPADINGNFGVTSLTLNGDQLYATSRFTASALHIVPSLPQLACTLTKDPPADFSLIGSDGINSPLPGVEIRGIEFEPPRTGVSARAFILQRVPPALVGFDLARGENGVFGNFPTDVIEVCQAPTFLQKDRTPEEEKNGADDALLYVTCFEQSQVYIIDPRVPRLVAVMPVGRGPAGLEFAKWTADGPRLAYVVGFGSNNIEVVDLKAGSETQFHVIQRIGFPNVVPR
jgi:hypothetical protein